MATRPFQPLVLLAGFMAVPLAALAQGAGGGLPSPELIQRADSFKPPTLADYAARLASQPDMTGLWRAMQPADAGVGPTFDPVNTFWPPQPVRGEARFGPMPGTYLKGVPYTPDYQRRYQQYIKDATEGKARDTFAACFPYGVPRMIGDSPVPFDIIQSPEVMFWYNDYGRTERRIFLDGRPHPTTPTPTGEFGPSYSGHSVGRWEGHTLVVDTVGMIAGNFDETAAPYSEQLRMVERMRLIDTNILEIQMTFTDPVAFERPWVVTRYFRRVPGVGAPAMPTPGVGAPAATPAPAPGSPEPIVRAFLNLNDRPCVPNVRMDENGFQVILLPQEVEAEAAKARGIRQP